MHVQVSRYLHNVEYEESVHTGVEAGEKGKERESYVLYIRELSCDLLPPA